MFGRNQIALMVAEFLGVGILTIAVLVAPGRLGSALFVALAAGLTFGGVNYLLGSHANPALTVGLWTMRRVETVQAVVRITMQMLGGLAAWQLIEYLINNQLGNRAGDNFDWRVLLVEALGGMVFGLGAAVATRRANSDEQVAFIRGLALTLAILVASLAGNGLVNPAVALGAQSWNWAYTLGPILGTIIGMALYGMLFAPVAVRPAKAATSRTAVRKTSAAKRPVKKSAVRRKTK